MIMSDAALGIALAGLVPLLAYIMWSDMKAMRIPNIAVLLIFLVFLATGSWGLPLETFLWRIGHTVIAFGVGWGIFQISGGKIGGGDLKLLIALVPFVPGSAVGIVLLMWAVITLVSLGGFFLARRLIGERETGYIALSQKAYFPAGVPIGLTMILFLGLSLAKAL